MHGVTLHDYQSEAVERQRESMRGGCRRPLYVLPTDGGKTTMFAALAASAVERGKRVVVLAHRRELVSQAAGRLSAVGVETGIVAPWAPASAEAPAQVASVQTLARWIGDMAPLTGGCARLGDGLWADFSEPLQPRLGGLAPFSVPQLDRRADLPEGLVGFDTR